MISSIRLRQKSEMKDKRKKKKEISKNQMDQIKGIEELEHKIKKALDLKEHKQPKPKDDEEESEEDDDHTHK